MNQRTVELNERAFEICGAINPIDFNYLEIPSCKNASLREALLVYSDTPLAAIIKQMSLLLNPKYKFPLVDVKLHILTQGDVPCIPGWHIDGGPDIESEYLLCVAGVSLTDFCVSKFSLPYNKDTRVFCNTLDAALSDYEAVQAKDWQITKYNNSTPHRGTPATSNGRRLLIRVMGSNKIPPQPIKDWKPLIARSGVKHGI